MRLWRRVMWRPAPSAAASPCTALWPPECPRAGALERRLRKQTTERLSERNSRVSCFPSIPVLWGCGGWTCLTEAPAGVFLGCGGWTCLTEAPAGMLLGQVWNLELGI